MSMPKKLKKKLEQFSTTNLKGFWIFSYIYCLKEVHEDLAKMKCVLYNLCYTAFTITLPYIQKKNRRLMVNLSVNINTIWDSPKRISNIKSLKRHKNSIHTTKNTKSEACLFQN